MLRLAWPVLVEQILIMMVGLVDLWLTGRYLEERHLAAIGLMSYVLWLIPCMFGMVGIGATALIARFVGGGDDESARRVTNQSLIAGGVLALLITLLVLMGGGHFVTLTRLSGESVPLARQYLTILTPVIPLMMIAFVGIASLRGAGDTLSGFITMSVVNVVNIVVGASLVIGWGPIPKIGWAGLPIGTACGHAVGGLVVLAMLIAGRAGMQLRWDLLRPNGKWLKRILRVGFPGGLDQTIIVCCHLWFLSIINSLGTLSAAAHGLGVRIESLAYMPGTAFQVAAATLAGQFLGAGDPRRATRSVMMACAVGGSLMVSAGAMFFFQGDWLTSLFLGKATRQTADLAIPLLKIVALAMPPFALSTILIGGLRGAGDTRWPLVFTLVGFIGVRIPLAYWLAWESFAIPLLGVTVTGFGLGVVGAWYAMLVDVIFRSVMVVWRFAGGGWRRVNV
jgi:putative MATE family efflux protein